MPVSICLAPWTITEFWVGLLRVLWRMSMVQWSLVFCHVLRKRWTSPSVFSLSKSVHLWGSTFFWFPVFAIICTFTGIQLTSDFCFSGLPRGSLKDRCRSVCHMNEKLSAKPGEKRKFVETVKSSGPSKVPRTENAEQAIGWQVRLNWFSHILPIGAQKKSKQPEFHFWPHLLHINIYIGCRSAYENMLLESLQKGKRTKVKMLS